MKNIRSAILAATLLVTQAAGQEAQASLYTRASGEGVSAALVIRIQ